MKKLPRPIWTNAPAAICDVEHRGYRFRIEVHANFGGAVWIKIKHDWGEEIDVPHEVSRRFWKDADYWQWKMTREAGEHGELDLELPHRAVIRMLDAAIVEHECKNAEQAANSKAGGILRQLREKAKATKGGGSHATSTLP